MEIDENKNGVRDDIEIFVYQNITKEKAKFGVYLEYSRQLKHFLNSEGNNEKAMGHQINTLALQDCLSKKEKEPLIVGNHISSIVMLVINSKSKRDKYTRLVNKLGYPLNKDVEKKGMACKI